MAIPTIEQMLAGEYPHLAELVRVLFQQTKDPSAPYTRRKRAELVLKDIRPLATRANLENAA